MSDNGKWMIIVIVLAIMLILMTTRSCNESKSLDNYKEMVNHLEDTVTTYRNTNNEQVAKIKVLESSSVSDFLKLRTTNLEVQRLQEVVKENKLKSGSATVINTTTEVVKSGTTIVKGRDTIYKDKLVYVYPEYNFDVNDTWLLGSVKSNRDTTLIDLKVFNEYDVVVKSGKNPYAIVTNRNPYSSTTSMKTYQVSLPKPKKFGIGLQVGYGATLYDNVFRLAPYVGVGLSYNIIRF